MKHPFVFFLFALALCSNSTWAQTATDLNEGTQLTYDSVDDNWTFSWWGRSGITYFIQKSDDLMSWQYAPVIEPGQDGVVEWNFDPSADKLFMRLKYTDITTADPLGDDFDSDGISNQNELTLGTSPLDKDTDGDLVNDGDELALETNPLNIDSDGDTVGDFVEVFIGSDPTIPYDLAIYYVSTTGLDSNSGTEAQPFATIERALQGISGPTAVHIASGTYTGFTNVVTGSIALLGEESENPVVLTQAANGTPFAQTVMFSDANGDSALQPEREPVWIDAGATAGFFDAGDTVLLDPRNSLTFDILGTAISNVLFADTNANGVHDPGESIYSDGGIQAGIYDQDDSLLNEGQSVLSLSSVQTVYISDLDFTGPSKGIEISTATDVFMKNSLFRLGAPVAVAIEDSSLEFLNINLLENAAIRWNSTSALDIKKMGNE